MLGGQPHTDMVSSKQTRTARLKVRRIWVVPSLDVRYPHLGRCQCSYWVCIDRVDEDRVRNVFLLYMPPGNREAIVHYQDTIVNRVALERVRPFVSDNLRARLIGLFGSNSIAVWGSEGGPRNRSNFERMS